jgi:GNAT superfamily N-acetyltransferase
MNRIAHIDPRVSRRPKLKLSDVMIRHLTPNDNHDAFKIDRDVFGDDFWNPLQFRYCVTTVGMHGHALIHNGMLSGYLLYSIAGDVWEIERMAILRRKQRWGLGGFLLNTVTRDRRRDRVTETWCDVPERNLPMQCFLRDHGFAYAGTVEHDEGPHYRFVWSRPEQDSSALARIR